MVTTTANMPVDKMDETAPEYAGSRRVSQTPPTADDLARVADIPLLDAHGAAVPFSSLHAADGERRTLIIFVRHFFCGNCQEYLRTLCSSITPAVLAGLATPTDIVVIGHGQPDLIAFYAETTACPYPIYAEPSKTLYAEWGMGRTLDLGPSKPEYMQKSMPSLMLGSIHQALSVGRRAFHGGNFSQVGGEFLLERGVVRWCHRMNNTRDHAEVPTVRRALDLPDETPPERRSSKRRSVLGRASSLRSGARSRSRNPEEGSRAAEPALLPVGEDTAKVSVAA